MRLDIISDVACPWCYVAKGYLDRALDARPDHPFQLEWHPFQLHPELPPDGMDRAAFLAARFGGTDSIVAVHAPLLAHAERAGVAFDLPSIRRTPNTLDAHRLIHWAGLEGRQTEMVSALFHGYWRDGQDIGDAATLARLAGDCGLDAGMVARLLASDADRDSVMARMHHSQSRGVSGVPTFVIDGRHVAQGAQPTEVWTGLIDELAAVTGDEA